LKKKKEEDRKCSLKLKNLDNTRLPKDWKTKIKKDVMRKNSQTFGKFAQKNWLFLSNRKKKKLDYEIKNSRTFRKNKQTTGL
jgi:hypothetical protein